MTQSTPTPNPATSTRPERSSKRVARKKPLRFLPWMVLGLLALLLAGIFLLINAVDDDGPDGPAGDRLGQVGSNGSGVDGQDGDGRIAGTEGDSDQAGSGSSGQSGAAPSGSGTGQPDGAATGQAALRVGDQDLLALSSGSLTGTAGTAVTGSARVQSVVSDEGFWVGNSSAERVFVYLTPQARGADGESPFQVRAGQTVQLTGELTPVGSGPSSLADVTQAEGRAQLQQQGSFVSATTVTLAD